MKIPAMKDQITINLIKAKPHHTTDHWEIYQSAESNHLYFLCYDTAYAILGETHNLVANVELSKGIAKINYMIVDGIEALNIYLADGSILILTNSNLHSDTEEALETQKEVVTIISPYKMQRSGSPSTRIKPHASLKVIEKIQLQ